MEALAQIVDVVGNTAQDLAAGLLVEIRQRQPIELGFHVGTQSVHGALDDPGDEVPLRPHEDRRRHVQQQHEEKNPSEGSEVDAGPWHRIGAAQQVGEPTVASRPGLGNCLILGDAGRQLFSDDTGEDQVSGMPEELRADDAERDTDHTQGNKQHDHAPLRCQPFEQPAGRGAEVERLLPGLAERLPEWPPSRSGPATDGRPGWRSCRQSGHAGTSAAICDATISA